ncbi:hypothetical protein FIBSPDRAFT_1043159 [Athelia psychrophila]|uniref:Uncharacterized protein n=1 Tax=Athelia psychrophila TaxID=1759441 RepID=A0A166LIX3_9AGAM|nr:hypothetical protein FIBSPDRAFT_1043159 [Fibularhizoctonia sp. CBS 109695]
MNTDVGGVGVRVSFYLQALFIGFQAARSGSKEDIRGAEYNLIVTNIAMAVTALFLGLKPNPDISFHEQRPGRLVPSQPLLGGQYLPASIVVFAFALAVLITAPRFGSHPECNHHAWLVLLRPIKVFNTGRIVGGVGCGIVIFLYIGMVVLGKYKEAKMEKEPAVEVPPNAATSQPDKDMPIRKPILDPDVEKTVLDALAEHRDKGKGHTWKRDVDYPLTGYLLIILVMWALAVMNTELLIVWNKFAQSDDPQSIWQFGQILPLLLIIVPFVGMIEIFMAHGLREVAKKEKSKVV